MQPIQQGRLSVVIPHWNAKQFLPVCLMALANQTHPDVEVIVVDNASSDGSQDYIKTEHPVPSPHLALAPYSSFEKIELRLAVAIEHKMIKENVIIAAVSQKRATDLFFAKRKSGLLLKPFL